MSQYDKYFKEASAQTGVSEDMLKAIAKTESNYDANALSSAGAVGVMQLLPSTFDTVSDGDITDPHDNILAGATYYSQLLQQAGGDQVKALAMYNGGPGGVSKNGVEAYSNYTSKVLDNLDEIRASGTGETVADTVEPETKWWGDIVVVVLTILVALIGVVLIAVSFGVGTPALNKIKAIKEVAGNE